MYILAENRGDRVCFTFPVMQSLQVIFVVILQEYPETLFHVFFEQEVNCRLCFETAQAFFYPDDRIDHLFLVEISITVYKMIQSRFKWDLEEKYGCATHR